MSNEEVLEKLQIIVEDVLGRPVVLGLDTKASEVEGWDSVNHINIITVIEMTYHLRFRTSELEDIHNVGELVTLIQKKHR